VTSFPVNEFIHSPSSIQSFGNVSFLHKTSLPYRRSPDNMQRLSARVIAFVGSPVPPKSLSCCGDVSTYSGRAAVQQKSWSYGHLQTRAFGKCVIRSRNENYAEAAKSLNQKGLEHDESELNDTLAHEKERQTRAPWHREGSDLPPVARQRSAGAMVKGAEHFQLSVLRTSTNLTLGKLLTTPSRLLKLILPLTINDRNSDRKDVEPLALLVHSQQPLSYLERLIQSELPTIKNSKGEEKVPAIHFRAEDSQQDEIKPKSKTAHEEAEALEKEQKEQSDLEETHFDGQIEKTGILNRKKENEINTTHLGDGGVESFSGLGHEAPSPQQQDRRFVRWSSSTEIGDFIRDAARGKEFAVEIEGAPEEIRVAVPSFNDRTHYLRMRLRKTSTRLMDMASVKQECDMAAHRGAQRVALGGAGLLVGYWYVVYRLTFETDLGWDTMEPVTVSFHGM